MIILNMNKLYHNINVYYIKVTLLHSLHTYSRIYYSPEYSAFFLIGWQSCQTADWLIPPGVWEHRCGSLRVRLGEPRGRMKGFWQGTWCPGLSALGPPRCILGLAPCILGRAGWGGRGSGCLSLVSLHGLEWVLWGKPDVKVCKHSSL